jgi:FkbM family methyltransferase
VQPLSLNLVDRLRRLARRRELLPATALLLRARTVRPASVFVLRELAGSSGPCAYRLRQQDMRVAVRHRTGDVVTLGEVFHDRHYHPIPEVEAALERVHSIVDLGANVGLFGAFAAARWPEAQIVAYEPDPANASVHERTIALNGLWERWRITRAAAGAREGSAQFVAGAFALSHIAEMSGGVACASDSAWPTIEVAVEDVVPLLATADLVKMDIEGGEWPILADPRFHSTPPRAIVLEYHPRLCPSNDPRAAAEAALVAASLNLRSIWHRSDGHGMLWAWRT